MLYSVSVYVIINSLLCFLRDKKSMLYCAFLFSKTLYVSGHAKL